MKLCQSCAMPLEKVEDFAKNQDGSKNEDYCQYCYADGKFTSETTMEEMIDFCAPMMVKSGSVKTKEEAVEQMNKFFPTLKRWAK